MAIVSVTVASGQGVSSLFTLEPAMGLWTFVVPSMTGQGVRLQFAPSNVATIPDFFTLIHPVTADFVVPSSSIRPAAMVFQPPTPWGRVMMATSVTGVASGPTGPAGMTFTLTPVRGA